MLTKNSLFALATVLTLATGCAVKNKTNILPNGESKIEKGTQTQPQISTMDDQIGLAFGEIGWTRQSAALSVNPPNLSSHEGCVTRMPLQGIRFLMESFDCKRVSDASDTQPNRRFEINGSQSYTLQRGSYEVDGALTTHIYTQANPTKLLSQGLINRKLEIDAPTGAPGRADLNPVDLKSAVYKASSTTTYLGDVAQDSKRLPEAWTATFDGSFLSGVSQPLTVLSGASVSLSYTPEAEENAKRTSQVITLVATSDISFVANGSCLRPVGTFAWTMGQDAAASTVVLTASATGYTRADDKSTHLWGKRCLER
jgi:hypothetical protein